MFSFNIIDYLGVLHHAPWSLSLPSSLEYFAWFCILLWYIEFFFCLKLRKRSSLSTWEAKIHKGWQIHMFCSISTSVCFQGLSHQYFTDYYWLFYINKCGFAFFIVLVNSGLKGLINLKSFSLFHYFCCCYNLTASILLMTQPEDCSCPYGMSNHSIWRNSIPTLYSELRKIH